ADGLMRRAGTAVGHVTRVPDAEDRKGPPSGPNAGRAALSGTSSSRAPTSSASEDGLGRSPIWINGCGIAIERSDANAGSNAPSARPARVSLADRKAKRTDRSGLQSTTPIPPTLRRKAAA